MILDVQHCVVRSVNPFVLVPRVPKKFMLLSWLFQNSANKGKETKKMKEKLAIKSLCFAFYNILEGV